MLFIDLEKKKPPEGGLNSFADLFRQVLIVLIY